MDNKEGQKCSNKQKTDEKTFHCLQTEATEDIQRTQGILTENQGTIKQTLDTINGSLTRIYDLYKEQGKRLDASDKNFQDKFQEVHDFMVKKNTTNGYIEKEINDSRINIQAGHDNRLGIEVRITRLESNYTNIIELLKEKKTDANTSWSKRQQLIVLALSAISIFIAAIALFRGF